MHRTSKYYVTYVIAAVNIAVYVYTSLIGGNLLETNYFVLLTYGQWNSLVLNGWFWQLLTSMFVHVSIVHLAGNMLFLLIFGLRDEELFSLKEYLLIYFGTGLAGNLLTLVPTLLFGWDMVSAGASGAIFGLFGAGVIYIHRTIGQSILTALIYSFFMLMLSSGPRVNNAAHLGGLAFGLLIGYLLATRRKPRPKYEYSFKYST